MNEKVKEVLVWNLEPTVRVGHFFLGDAIENYKEKFRLFPPSYDTDDSEIYNISGTESYLSIQDGKIIYVDCCDSCIYKGIDLIGLKYSELLEVLGCTPDEVDDSAVQYENGVEEYSITFNELDLIIWIDNHTSTVKSVSCGEGDEED